MMSNYPKEFIEKYVNELKYSTEDGESLYVKRVEDSDTLKWRIAATDGHLYWYNVVTKKWGIWIGIRDKKSDDYVFYNIADAINTAISINGPKAQNRKRGVAVNA